MNTQKNFGKFIGLAVLGAGLLGLLAYQNCAPAGGGSGAFNLNSGSQASPTPGPSASPTPSPSPSPTPAYESTVLNDNPLYFWPLNASSGSTETDIKGANTGLGEGTYTVGVAGGVPGEASNLALQLANGGYMATSSKLTFPTVVSIEVWFNTTQQGRIMGWGDGQLGTCVETNGLPCSEYNIYIGSTNKLIFAIAVTNGVAVAPAFISSTGNYNDGKWHHVVAAFDQTKMYLFEDGVQDANSPYTPGFPIYALSAQGYWRLGPDNIVGYTNAPASPNYTGLLQDAAIYGSILSPTQVMNHYNAGLAH